MPCAQDLGRNCAECNSRKSVLTERWLTRRPKTFILSLVWPSSNPSRDQLWSLLSMIQPQLRMEEIFKVEPAARSEVYCFRGMICYCGMHYVALFWCPAKRRWIFFDDMCVKEKEDWTAVVNLMTAGQCLGCRKCCGSSLVMAFHKRTAKNLPSIPQDSLTVMGAPENQPTSIHHTSACPNCNMFMTVCVVYFKVRF